VVTAAAVPAQRREPYDLRALAARGELATLAATAGADVAAALRADAFAFAYPLVYDRHTRALERHRRHPRCAASLEYLEADCHDGFTDDVVACVDYLLRYAKQPIRNLDGWLVSRIPTATVDGHRRRRGELGALQRPRVPKWLAARLGHDPWLVELAARILDWVGVPTTAGLETWPLVAWAELRGRRTGRWADSTDAAVRRDVARVLEAMRAGDPEWYRARVETPLGAKRPPVVDAELVAGSVPAADLAGQALAAADERADAVLARRAGEIIDALVPRLAVGEDPAAAVRRVVPALLGPGLDDEQAERVARALRDPLVVCRVVEVARTAAAQRRANTTWTTMISEKFAPSAWIA
jgi:hypothetical protein